MAGFARSGLALLVGTNIRNLWAYNTDDAAATVNSSGYFNAMVNEMKVGDWIFSKCNGVHGVHIVQSNNGTVVDVQDAQVAGTTDTD